MANEFKVRKGLIVQGSGSNIFDVQGSQGQLFSVTDSLSGSLFSVNDISGIPIMEVFSDNTIKMGTFNQEAIIISGSRTGMGTALPQAELHISGANNDSLFRIQSPASASIIFVTGSGLVGIGTLTPTQKLSVDNGNVGFTSGFGISWDSDTEWIKRAAASDQLQIATQNTVRLNIGSTQGQLVAIGLGTTAASAQFQVRGGGATAATTAFRVENSNASASLVVLDDGTVGIGTTSPSAQLHVSGSATTPLRVQNPATTLMQISSSATNSGSIVFFGTTPTSGLDLEIQSNGAANGGQVRIAGNGTQWDFGSVSAVVRNGTGNPEMFGATMTGTSTTLVQNPFRVQFNANQSSTGGGGYTVLRVNATHATTAGTGSKLLQTWEFGGNAQSVIDISGSLGIGTGSAPNARLFVSGANADTLLRVGSPTNANILFVSGSGNIGVGTTTPGVTLDVVGSIRASNTMFNSVTQTNNIQLSSAFLRFLSASVETARYDSNGWGFFNNAPAAKVHISGANADALFRVSSPSATNALFVSGSGNVGIGTTSPTERLHVDGNLLVTGRITAEEFHTEFVSASIIYQSGSTQFGNSSDDTHIFTGSLSVSGSITGSLYGTASWAENAQTATLALTASSFSGQNFATFTQSVASTTWTFNHNLNFRTPVITVYDNSYQVVVPDSIQGTSDNQSVITFSTARAGYASATVGSVLPNNALSLMIAYSIVL